MTFQEFKYSSAAELQSLSSTAVLDSYSGGGYVYKVKGSAKTIEKSLLELKRLYWIDNNTRAVFLEFSAFNPNASFFIYM